MSVINVVVVQKKRWSRKKISRPKIVSFYSFTFYGDVEY